MPQGGKENYLGDDSAIASLANGQAGVGRASNLQVGFEPAAGSLPLDSAAGPGFVRA